MRPVHDTSHCDHCYPDALHACARPVGHRGYCSCVVQDEDYEEDEPCLCDTDFTCLACHIEGTTP